MNVGLANSPGPMGVAGTVGVLGVGVGRTGHCGIRLLGSSPALPKL